METSNTINTNRWGTKTCRLIMIHTVHLMTSYDFCWAHEQYQEFAHVEVAGDLLGVQNTTQPDPCYETHSVSIMGILAKQAWMSRMWGKLKRWYRGRDPPSEIRKFSTDFEKFVGWPRPHTWPVSDQIGGSRSRDITTHHVTLKNLPKLAPPLTLISFL